MAVYYFKADMEHSFLNTTEKIFGNKANILVQSEIASIFLIAESCITLKSFNQHLNRIFFHMSWFLLRIVSSAPLHHLRFPIHRQDLLLITSSELLRHHPLFCYLLRKKLSIDLKDVFAR